MSTIRKNVRIRAAVSTAIALAVIVMMPSGVAFAADSDPGIGIPSWFAFDWIGDFLGPLLNPGGWSWGWGS